MTVLIVVIILVLCLLSGFFSASQTALLSLSSMQVKLFGQSKDERKLLIARLVSRPRNLLVTLFMLDTLVNLLVQNFASSLFGMYSTWALRVGVPLLLTLIIGEIIPKSLAFAHKSKVAFLVAPTIFRIEKIVEPIRDFLTVITTYVSAALFFFLKKEKEISEEELHHVLKTSQIHGILSKEEAHLIDGYLILQEATVKELMRPRDEVLIYHLDEQISRLTHLFVEEACSRIPVCLTNVDDIKGVISARDFFLNRDKIHTSSDLVSFLKQPFFVPEMTKARFLLKQFSQRRESLAIVVNEYGLFSGLITHEDLVETVVGDIADRRDEKRLYTRSGENVVIASGKLELMEFEEIFNVKLESPVNQVTIGGWLTEQLGDIPKAGTQYESSGFLFKVLAADPTRVRRVYIRKLHAHKLAKSGAYHGA
ncbi:MAG: hemolysin family protein [Chlamydiales bacterium]|nr:hemolysin family protein [Chlamydiales bacterium]